MNTTLLRLALLEATTSQLEAVIDWLDRPWAPGKNDALRAAWHEAKHSDGARRALAFAIEEEVRSLSTERDLAHVGQRLGLAARGIDAAAVSSEIVRRLGGITSWPLPVSPDLVIGALSAIADIARFVRGDAGRGGGRRRHRHRGRPGQRRHQHGC